MAYQYKREPLIQEEANQLASACEAPEEKLVVWTLLNTGLRVAELASLDRDKIDWLGHRITIFGKGGPFGSRSKRRVLPSPPASSRSSRTTSLCTTGCG